MIRLASLLLVGVLACHAAAPPVAPVLAPATETSVDGLPFVRVTVAAQGLRYYLAASPAGPRPLLVVVQGSGCEPLFVPRGARLGATAGQDLLVGLAAGRFVVLVVEKPGVVSEAAPAAGATGPGTSDECTRAFRDQHSLARWSAQLSLAIDRALRDPRVTPGPVRLLGLSEGAITVARVARERPDVANVAFISGFGCDQWRDMLIAARREAEPDGADAIAAALGTMEVGLAAVAADPTNPDKLFEGQTFLFWSTFGRACPAADLAQSRADVFVACGTADEQVDSSGVEAITAARLAAGKPVTTRRILGGSHILDTPGAKPFANLLAVFTEALAWMSVR